MKRYTHLPGLGEGVAVAEVGEGDERLVTLCIRENKSERMSEPAWLYARRVVRTLNLRLRMEDGMSACFVVAVVDGEPAASPVGDGQRGGGQRKRQAEDEGCC